MLHGRMPSWLITFLALRPLLASGSISNVSRMHFQVMANGTFHREASFAEEHGPQAGFACGHPMQSSAGRMRLCSAWGDPHYTANFAGRQPYDKMGVGPLKIAESSDGDFKVEGFQCPFPRAIAGDWNRDKNGPCVNVGFAIKISGHVVTVVNGKVWLDGNEKPETDLPIKTPTGLSIRLANGHFCINSGDKWIKKTVASVQIERRGCSWAPVKYYQNVHVEIAESQMSKSGICYDPNMDASIKHSLFPKSVLPSLCKKCYPDPSHCESKQTPNLSPEEICQGVPFSYEKGKRACEPIQHHAAYYRSCIVDFCMSKGDEDLVRDAIQALAEDESLEAPWSAPKDESLTILAEVNALEAAIRETKDHVVKMEAEEQAAKSSATQGIDDRTKKTDEAQKAANAMHTEVTQQNAGLDELENQIKSAMDKTKTELGVNRQAMQAQQATMQKLAEQISGTEDAAKTLAETILPAILQNRDLIGQQAQEALVTMEAKVYTPLDPLVNDVATNLGGLSQSLKEAQTAAVSNREEADQRARASSQEKKDIAAAVKEMVKTNTKMINQFEDRFEVDKESIRKLREDAAAHQIVERQSQEDIQSQLNRVHQVVSTEASSVKSVTEDLHDLIEVAQKELENGTKRGVAETRKIIGAAKVLDRSQGNLQKDLDKVEEVSGSATDTVVHKSLLSLNNSLKEELDQVHSQVAQSEQALQSERKESKEFNTQFKDHQDTDKEMLGNMVAQLGVIAEVLKTG